MNRKNNKKGFTIVELVIVIAVIGILAAVMIPTISGVIANANVAAAEADAKALYTQYATAQAQDNEDVGDVVIYVKSGNVVRYYYVEDGSYSADNYKETYDEAVSALTVPSGKCFAKEPTEGLNLLGDHTVAEGETTCSRCGEAE